MSYIKQDLIKSHAILFILSQSSSVVDARFFSNRRMSSRFDAVSASITSHLYILKVVLVVELHHINPQRMWIWCTFSSHLRNWFLKAMRKQTELDKNKLDKDRIFTSTRNPRRVSEAIYSSKLIPWAIHTLFWDRHTIPQTIPTLLRDRHTISAGQQLMLLESTHDSTSNLGCSDTTCCARAPLKITPLRNPPNGDWCSQRCTQHDKNREL